MLTVLHMTQDPGPAASAATACAWPGTAYPFMQVHRSGDVLCIGNTAKSQGKNGHSSTTEVVPFPAVGKVC